MYLSIWITRGLSITHPHLGTRKHRDKYLLPVNGRQTRDLSKFALLFLVNHFESDSECLEIIENASVTEGRCCRVDTASEIIYLTMKESERYIFTNCFGSVSLSSSRARAEEATQPEVPMYPRSGPRQMANAKKNEK